MPPAGTKTLFYLTLWGNILILKHLTTTSSGGSMGTRRPGRAWAWSLALLMAAPAGAAAQGNDLTPLASDSFLALVPPRDLVDIQRDIASAEADRASAAEAQQNAVALRNGLDVQDRGEEAGDQDHQESEGCRQEGKARCGSGLLRGRRKGAGAGEGPPRATEVAARGGDRSREKADGAGDPRPPGAGAGEPARPQACRAYPTRSGERGGDPAGAR